MVDSGFFQNKNCLVAIREAFDNLHGLLQSINNLKKIITPEIALFYSNALPYNFETNFLGTFEKFVVKPDMGISRKDLEDLFKAFELRNQQFEKLVKINKENPIKLDPVEQELMQHYLRTQNELLKAFEAFQYSFGDANRWKSPLFPPSPLSTPLDVEPEGPSFEQAVRRQPPDAPPDLFTSKSQSINPSTPPASNYGLYPGINKGRPILNIEIGGNFERWLQKNAPLIIARYKDNPVMSNISRTLQRITNPTNSKPWHIERFEAISLSQFILEELKKQASHRHSPGFFSEPSDPLKQVAERLHLFGWTSPAQSEEKANSRVDFKP